MKMFQLKLHRVMIQSIQLYADNIVSMDICGWSVIGAKQILGDTVSSVFYCVTIDCGISL